MALWIRKFRHEFSSILLWSEAMSARDGIPNRIVIAIARFVQPS